ncbi:MAG: phosphatase PAP2 family protein [Proteobacteria bacterium]|nr:phosphatase PAP2 family protein [Pseudomonadota bacterium]
MKRIARTCTLVALLLAFSAPGRPATPPQPGYLSPGETLHIEAWLPPAPAPDSLSQAADIEAFFATRTLIGTPRGEEAHADDVVGPAEAVALRFTYLMGVTLDRKNAPTLMHMMDRLRADEQALMAPVKKDVTKGGRHRPFVEYPGRPTCPLEFAALGETGSYPSGHSGLGWLWGATLAELAPQYADALLARGIAFGESRVVCGFHYPSDIMAGRLATAALLQRVHGDPQFLKDLVQARKEVAAALAAARK